MLAWGEKHFKGHEVPLGADEYVHLYLDCDYGYTGICMCQTSNHTL